MRLGWTWKHEDFDYAQSPLQTLVDNAQGWGRCVNKGLLRGQEPFIIHALRPPFVGFAPCNVFGH